MLALDRSSVQRQIKFDMLHLEMNEGNEELSKATKID